MLDQRGGLAQELREEEPGLAQRHGKFPQDTVHGVEPRLDRRPTAPATVPDNAGSREQIAEQQEQAEAPRRPGRTQGREGQYRPQNQLLRDAHQWCRATGRARRPSSIGEPVADLPPPPLAKVDHRRVVQAISASSRTIFQPRCRSRTHSSGSSPAFIVGLNPPTWRRAAMRAIAIPPQALISPTGIYHSRAASRW